MFRSRSPPYPVPGCGVSREPRFGRGGFGEDLGEAAVGHGGADVGGVARPLEQVGIDVEGDRRARVAEDAADLADVEAQVDDQVAGEGVAQVVEAKRRPACPSRPARLTAWARAVRATFRCASGVPCRVAKT